MNGLNTGNYINYWGVQLTPYARAIMSGYRIAVPVFITVPTNLTGTVREEIQVLTDPFEYDVLLVAANINMGTASNGDDGAMPVLKLPEAVFLPAGVQLKHQWKVFSSTATSGSITWLAIQLIDPLGGNTNAASSAITGGVITLRHLKLTLPIDGGWNYGQGL